jgi:hypothetical protein
VTQEGLIGTLVGTLLTVIVLSYIIWDNPLYRLALHLLVGATVGYGVAVASFTVFVRTILPALQGEPAERFWMVGPVVLSLLLLMKGFPRSRLVAAGNLATAYLIGVGAAVAMAGALLGTIVPQTVAAGSFTDWLEMGLPGLVNGVLVLVGTICALLAFTFTGPRRQSGQPLWNSTVGLAGRVGRGFLLAAFGAAFATALTASLSILIGRIYAVVDGVQRLLRLLGG